MNEKAVIKAISTKRGSVLLEKDGEEKWSYVADNLKPHVNKLNKGPAEFKMDYESGTIVFIKNTTTTTTAAAPEKSFNMPANKPKKDPTIADTARLRRITDCIRMAVDLCIAEKIPLSEIERKSVELYEQINHITS